MVLKKCEESIEKARRLYNVALITEFYLRSYIRILDQFLQELCGKPRPCRAGMNARLKLRTKDDIIISNFGIKRIGLE